MYKPPPARFTLRATCDDCNFNGTIHELEMHSCSAEETRQANGGRCEDYPCCGHTDGDGCSPRQEHTKDYWLERMMATDEDGNDLYDDMDY